MKAVLLMNHGGPEMLRYGEAPDPTASAMPLTGLTALWALEDTAQLKAGETILIQGGAGGVAGFGIQLAKHLGATVITTASARNHDYVRRLGADRVIDYNAEDFTKAVADCDVVFDTVGGDVQLRSYAVLKPGGRLVWIAPAPEGAPARCSDGRRAAATRSPTGETAMTATAQKIIELDRKRMQAMAQKDIATLHALLSDDLVYTHSTARLDTKTSLIEAMESGRTVYTAVEPSDVQAQELGDAVVLTGSARIAVLSSGNPVSFRVRFTDVYANKGGQWQMVAWQSTRIPE